MQALTILTEEHRNLWRVAIAVEAVLDQVAAGGDPETAFFQSLLDYLDHYMDGFHHAKEDQHLFPGLRRHTSRLDDTIARLHADHRDAAAALVALRAGLGDLSGPEPARGKAIARWRDYLTLLRDHVALEEKTVMPALRELLTEQEWGVIDHAFGPAGDPVFGAGARADYAELYHRIVNLAPDGIGLGGHGGGHLWDAAAKPLLEIHGLESAYGRIKALKGIDLVVRQGELVALVGANGAGKTTFLRTLSGIHPAAGGRIVFDGADITFLRPDLRVRRGICQSPEGRQVFGALSIADNLALGAYTRADDAVAADLDRVYTMFPVLKEKRALPAGTLSGGQQQMLAIGRALMGRPRLLLLDEPTMGLAPLLIEEVFNVIKALRADGMTILLVEQNAFGALAIADRGYVLETGHVTLSGGGRELIENEQVRQAYLGL